MSKIKIGDAIIIPNCHRAWIGWITKSSYLISYIENIYDENGKITSKWLLGNLRVKWILKKDLNGLTLDKLK